MGREGRGASIATRGSKQRGASARGLFKKMKQSRIGGWSGRGAGRGARGARRGGYVLFLFLSPGGPSPPTRRTEGRRLATTSAPLLPRTHPEEVAGDCNNIC